MAAVHPLVYSYWAWLSKPVGDRRLYRGLGRQKPVRIVEIGLGSLERTVRVLRAAQRFARGETVQYTGVDLFDSRPASQPSLSLKNAHRVLKATGAQIRLAPGPPGAVLARWANTLSRTDLLLIGGVVEEESLLPAWFYVPRMLHAGSLIERELFADGGGAWRTVHRSEIDDKARGAAPRRAA